MTTWLTEEFVARVKHQPLAVSYKGHHVIVRRTDARRTGVPAYSAELEVVEDDVVLGYLTPYSETEHGAIPARLFGSALPVLHRTLDGALGEILRD